MASGDTLIELRQHSPPAGASVAPPDVIAGANSTAAESVLVINYAVSVDTLTDFVCRLGELYGGGGLTVTLPTAFTAIAGNVRFGAAIRRLDTAEDIDTTDHTYDFNYVSVAATDTIGKPAYPTVTFTDGADMDSLAAGDLFVLRVQRNGTNAADTMMGTAQLIFGGISGTET